MTTKCYTILPIKKESARRYDRIALGNYKELIEICDWSLRVVKKQSWKPTKHFFSVFLCADLKKIDQIRTKSNYCQLYQVSW